ncbi:MAG: DUF2865 domain-containing protein [Beijerinckiaceae bacterium]
MTALLVVSHPALANVCRSIEAELATMRGGVSQQVQREAARNAAEANRLYGYMRSIGCDRQSFLFFGQPPPAECGGYRARLAQLQAGSRIAGGHSEVRRRELMSMLVSYNCRTSPDPAPRQRSASLLGGLFDDSPNRSSIDGRSEEDERPRIESRIRRVSGKAVCVRMCDGYYFPLHVRNASLRDEGDGICQSLCPASEMKVFMMPGSIENAATPEGERYTEIPNAFRYRKSYDPGCFCRKPGETWAESRAAVLNPEEGSGKPGFGVLNADPVVEEEPFPLRGMTPVAGKSRKKQREELFGNRPPPEEILPPPPPAEAEGARIVAADQGEVRDLPGANGTRRIVRVIAPELSPVPSGARVPSVPGRDPSQ